MADAANTFPEEVWKPVAGLESFYEISSDGRLRSHDRRANAGQPSGRLIRGRVLKPTLHDGYPRACLRGASGKAEYMFVHRLVCAAYHGPCPDGHQVAHKNGIRTDNRAVNLRWALPVENGADRREHGTNTRGEGHSKAKLTEKDVLSIRARLEAGERKADLAREFSVSPRLMRLVETRAVWAWLA